MRAAASVATSPGSSSGPRVIPASPCRSTSSTAMLPSAVDGGLVPPGPPLQILDGGRTEPGEPELGQLALCLLGFQLHRRHLDLRRQPRARSLTSALVAAPSRRIPLYGCATNSPHPPGCRHPRRQLPATERTTGQNATPGTLEVPRIGLGAMGMSAVDAGAWPRRRRVDPHHPTRPRLRMQLSTLA